MHSGQQSQTKKGTLSTAKGYSTNNSVKSWGISVVPPSSFICGPLYPNKAMVNFLEKTKLEIQIDGLNI